MIPIIKLKEKYSQMTNKVKKKKKYIALIINFRMLSTYFDEITKK